MNPESKFAMGLRDWGSLLLLVAAAVGAGINAFSAYKNYTSDTHVDLAVLHTEVNNLKDQNKTLSDDVSALFNHAKDADGQREKLLEGEQKIICVIKPEDCLTSQSSALPLTKK